MNCRYRFRSSSAATVGHRNKRGGVQVRKIPANPDEIWADLLEGNRRFRAGRPAAKNYPRRRAALLRGQQPRVIVLGCADSRVSPSLVFDQNLGDLFVVRVAGNVADRAALGSLEYAAEVLRSPVLVVLGHEQCGAVAAAASGGKMPSAHLRSLMTRIRPALENAQGKPASARWLRAAERANVHQSARDLLHYSPLLGKKVAAGNLRLIKALYRLRTGKVIRLPE
jgi:carbonic anhydrase